MNEKYKKAVELIESSNSIYITAHINPDGDAIGSAFSMYLVLKNMGKDVHVIMPKYSDKFSFLEDLKFAEEKVDVNAYDLAISVDVSTIDRIAMSKEDFIKAKKRLVIDHHVFTNIDSDVSVVDNKAPATCQIIYEIFEDQDILIDKNIAQYLYLGILTDTGSFNYSNTNARTHMISSKLIEKGINFSYICQMVNDNIKENKLKLIAYAINNMETYLGGKLKYVKIDYAMMQSLGIDEEDAEGIVNYLRSVDGVEIAVYARELENGTYKVSMRSKGKIDVSKIATKFGGGGHINAAGFTADEEIDKVKNEIIELVGVNL